MPLFPTLLTALSPPFPLLSPLLSPYSTGVVWECVLVGKDLEKFGMCGSRVISVLKFTDLCRLSLSHFVTLKSIVNDFKNPKRLSSFHGRVWAFLYPRSLILVSISLPLISSRARVAACRVCHWVPKYRVTREMCAFVLLISVLVQVEIVTSFS